MKDPDLLSQIIQRFKTGPGLILLHHNADIDAICSAIALQSAYPKFKIGAFQNISQISKRFLNNFPDVDILSDPNIDEFKTIVVLDTSSPSQLGISQDLPEDIIVIDHHKYNELWKTKYYYSDDTKRSCAEIIYEVFKLTGFTITPKIALALMAGILTDTGHFKYAESQTLINFAEILKKSELSIEDIFKKLESSDSMDISQRIAHLKGSQRLKFRHCKEYIIAYSQISSYEASMCKYLLILGADVAIVGAQRDENIRLSMRAAAKLVNKGLHLGELCQQLGEELSCEGGGHAGAAGMNGEGDIEMILNACVATISQVLEKF